eukprot:TRINITY_DN7665_c0_g1_i1.p1 TRINITY_DN7665_c0_g1~~TRINITY_DN7665_c0_g1_i1.p1  ORF type:complete len:352 (+),score=51.14 TRINITY_DN7665_c0_g1_i1:296-1351(+)
MGDSDGEWSETELDSILLCMYTGSEDGEVVDAGSPLSHGKAAREGERAGEGERGGEGRREGGGETKAAAAGNGADGRGVGAQSALSGSASAPALARERNEHSVQSTPAHSSRHRVRYYTPGAGALLFRDQSFKCFRCGGEGHIAAKCPLTARRSTPEGRSRRGRDGVDEESADEAEIVRSIERELEGRGRSDGEDSDHSSEGEETRDFLLPDSNTPILGPRSRTNEENSSPENSSPDTPNVAKGTKLSTKSPIGRGTGTAYCYNCGMQGHVGSNCDEPSYEELQAISVGRKRPRSRSRSSSKGDGQSRKRAKHSAPAQPLSRANQKKKRKPKGREKKKKKKGQEQKRQGKG